MIEFKDYPDTTTPINAENLNGNFNELKNGYYSDDNVNANNYTKTGCYALGTGCTNIPESYVRLYVNGGPTNNIQTDLSQIAIGIVSNRMYFRSCANGYWSSWKEPMQYIRNLVSGDDFNLLRTGIYQYNGISGVSNAPSDIGIVEVIGGADYIIQRVTNAATIFIRSSYDVGANWSSWKSVTLT